jgi:cytochrome c oxidase cbb3-type subunit 3
MSREIMKKSAFLLGTIAFTIAASAPNALTAGGSDSETSTSYLIYCSKCHGQTGRGDGPNAATLKTKPRDFSDCSIMKTIDDNTIFKAIKEGGSAVNLPNDMPPWGQAFDDGEIHQLVTYVRNFCKS